MAIENWQLLEVPLPWKNKKEKKNERKNKEDNYWLSKNKKEAIGLEIHYQLSNDNCQLPKYPQNPGTL